MPILGWILPVQVFIFLSRIFLTEEVSHYVSEYDTAVKTKDSHTDGSKKFRRHSHLDTLICSSSVIISLRFSS